MAPYDYRLGNLDLRILSDGTFYQDAGAVFGIVPRVMWERRSTRARCAVPDGDRDELPARALAGQARAHRDGRRRQGGARTAGVAGGGRQRCWTSSTRLGVRPDDIDIVINTHLHADHCGWNTRKDGERVGADVPERALPDPARRVGGGDAPERAHARDVPRGEPAAARGRRASSSLIDGEHQVTRRDHDR